jgi:hypothetical protein
MNTMLNPIYTTTSTEAAQADSAPCRHLSVTDGSRTGFTPTLAERCMH